MKNIESDEIFDINIRYSELEQYLVDNPDVVQVFTKFPSTVDSVRLGVKKVDDNFKDVLKTVGGHHKKNEINTF